MKQRRKKNSLWTYIAVLLLCEAIWACSTTSAIPDGEQLFTGLKKIEFSNYEKSDYATATQEELGYVLASAPNGALFGSSYHMTPLPVRLWIWNAFSQSDDGFSRWMTKAFGQQPKLISKVNPRLRTSVAESQLDKWGYFNGKVDYDVIEMHNPKKAKIAYRVDMGHLWTLDSVGYENFPYAADTLIQQSLGDAIVKKGEPFNVNNLELERQRVARLLRNNGFYYYKSGFASYLADTVNVPGKVDLTLQMADSVGDEALRKWQIGKINVNLRKQYMDELTDSVGRRGLTVKFRGRRSPLRTGVILRSLKLRPGQLYDASKEEESLKNLQSTGLFSFTSMRFTPRENEELRMNNEETGPVKGELQEVRSDSSFSNLQSSSPSVLDLTIDCLFDKPYDFYIEANGRGKTSGYIGPELVVGLTKRNAFRGGEKIDVKAHGSYEWQTGHRSEGSKSGMNSYEYGGEASLILPRLLTPQSLFRKRRFDTGKPPRMRASHRYMTPTTTIRVAVNTLNRANYFKRHVVSGDITYDYWTSPQSHHTFSPFMLSYEYMNHTTAAMDSLMDENPFLRISMQDQFVPKMSYTYSYASPSTMRNPIAFSATLSEGGNLLAAGYAVFGEKWSEKGKTMFKNPFAQFVKAELDYVKTWQLGEKSSVAAHVSTGVIYSYGNSTVAPYYEQFYVGGANSIRAFNVRSIGPGKYKPSNSRMSYIEQTGDVKLLANLEYRPLLFGKLYGALFLDAGNVWTLHSDESRPEGQFKWGSFFEEIALGTGVGLRYDMGMFVIRVDWGIGLHVPYDTGKSGFYNMRSFGDSQSIHLAVGYPF